MNATEQRPHLRAAWDTIEPLERRRLLAAEFGPAQAISSEDDLTNPVTSVAADFDGDGDLDVAVVSHGERIAWYPNRGDGSFDAVRTITDDVGTSAGDFGRGGLAAGDINGDGQPDVVAAIYEYPNPGGDAKSKVAWYEYDVQADTWAEHIVSVDSIGGLQPVAIGDIDGDGDADIVSANYRFEESIRVVWFENVGNGLEWESRVISDDEAIGTGSRALALGDVDGDGWLDVAAAARFSGTVVVYFNPQDPQDPAADWAPVVLDTQMREATGVALADLDPDGALDVVASTDNPYDPESDFSRFRIGWYRNNPDQLGTFRAGTVIAPVGSIQRGWSIQATDLDLDGDPDLLFGSRKVGWFENLGGAQFDRAQDIGEEVQSWSWARAGDLNGDERPDVLAVANVTQSEVVWYENREPTPVTIDFENLPLGFIDSGIYEQDGFVFANVRGDGGALTDRLRVDAQNQRYESKILTTYNWARRLNVSRDDGSPFSVERFDYAAGRWTEPGDFVLTGHFIDGSIQTQEVSFTSRATTTLALNWENVLAFDLNAADGENNAYFAVDNFVFHTPEQEGPPFITGSLTDPDPVAGPARLRFDDRTWREIDDLVELPGGAFYALGHSGEETWTLPEFPPIQRLGPTDVLEWVTLHFIDGSIDRSFGDNGRMPLDDLVWDDRRYALTLDRTRLLGRPTDSGEEHIAAFNLDLSRDRSFADNGILRPSVDGESLTDLNHAVFDDGGLVVIGRGPGTVTHIQIFSPDGTLVASDPLQPILDAALPPNTARHGLQAEGSHGDGLIYFSLLKPSGSFSDRPFGGVLRLTTDLEVDSSYGTDGIARVEFDFVSQRLSGRGIFTGDDGRAAIELGVVSLGVLPGGGDFFEDYLIVFDPSGGNLGREILFGTPFDERVRVRVHSATFLADDDVAVAFSFLDGQQDGLVFEEGSFFATGFGTALYDFGDASGGSASKTFFDPGQPAGLNDAIPTSRGGFLLGGFLEDVERSTEEDDRRVIDIDHVGALWRVELK